MNQSRFITHITSAGERWDLLAWQYYGDPSLYSPIIMANPAIRIEPAFEPGLLIAIPVMQKPSATTSDLPPWKRKSSD